MGQIMLNGNIYTGGEVHADVHYSTNEQIVGTWIDGSTVYEKVVDLGTLPNATTKNVAHGISNLGILVSADFSAYDSQGYRFTFPYTVVDRNYFGYQVSVSLDTTNIIIVTDADRSAYSGYAILRYTKALA